jgi:rfaE bifunctional protein kinase chain/domain
MNRTELVTLLRDVQSATISVVGDFCLDAYWFIHSTAVEKSVETGIDVRLVDKQNYSLGGAGNVVMNLIALGVNRVHTIGVIGNDLFGKELSNILRKGNNINTEGLLTQEMGWDTHVYAKPYLNGSELNRIDFGRFNTLDDDIAKKLIGILEQSLATSDAVIINEQVESGIHNSPLFRTLLASLIRTHRKKIFLLDSRHYNDYYSGTIRKLNETAAAVLCGLERTPDDTITDAEAKDCILRLWKNWKDPIVLTRGERGSFIIDDSGFHEISGLRLTGRVDPVGAGDSMVAGTAAALATGAPLAKAAELGNISAGITVQKLFQTGTASPEEILAIGEHNHRPRSV